MNTPSSYLVQQFQTFIQTIKSAPIPSPPIIGPANAIHPIHIERETAAFALHDAIARLVETAQRVKVDHRVEIGLEIPRADHDRAVGEHVVRIVGFTQAVEGELGVTAVLRCPQGV